ncbi:MAG: cyclic nucleotide-binding serine/threonine-protein kinase, partial [Pseudomonadota bacterium]
MNNREDTGQTAAPSQADFLFLKGTPLFDAIPEQARFELTASMRPRRLRAGDRLIRQGDAGESFFVIRAGKCLVSVERAGKDQLLGRLGPGEIVGEMAIITGEKRTANVMAETDLHVLEVTRTDFDRMCADYPQLRKFVTKLVTARISETLTSAEYRIGKYLIERVIGEGGCSMVYGGRHSSLGIPVAMKMLKHEMAMDRAFLSQFRNEAATIAQLDHPNILKVYDVEEVFRTFFIVMEHVKGESLKDLLAKTERPSLSKITKVFLQICEGLL